MTHVGAGLETFFDARSVAIVGASAETTKIGGRPVHLLKKYGFAGAIRPVNPKGGEIQGLPAFASVRDLPEAPDLVLLAVPAAGALSAVDDCIARGAGAICVLSAGFAEAGPEGAAIQAEMVARARAAGIRLLGPNCLGSLGLASRTIGSFSIVLEDSLPPAGNVGIASQSGNLGSYIMHNVAERGLGVSRFIATGNEADVDVADAVANMAQDEQTRIILLIMETCRDAGRMITALDMARAAGKPVLVLKIGETEAGQAAAASHTGALAASDAVIDAVFRRAGAIRVRSLEELLDLGQAAALLRPDQLPQGRRVVSMAASGGFCIMMADAAAREGLEMPPLAESTKAAVLAALPASGVENPLDTTAQISARPETLQGVLNALADEPGVDVVQVFMSLSLYNSRLRGIYLDALAKMKARNPDKLIVVTSRGPADGVAQILSLGIPVFPSIDATARGIAALARMGEAVRGSREPPVWPAKASLDPGAFRNEAEAKAVLAAAGVPVLPEAVVSSADEAVAKAEAFGFPIVLKIVSEDIPHKTEAGGVRLNLGSTEAVRAAYDAILASVTAYVPGARIDGILVTPMARGGVGELIMGISRDPVFGPVVMVGIGGIYAEVLQDVAVQTAPVTETEALAMIRSLRLFAILDGARGQPKGDIAAAAQALAALSDFACRHVDDVAEIDLNPVLVRPAGEGIVALDALIVPHRPADTSH